MNKADHAADFMCEDAFRSLLDCYPGTERDARVSTEAYQRWKQATRELALEWFRVSGVSDD